MNSNYPPSESPSPAPRRRRPWLVGGLSVLAVASAAGAWLAADEMRTSRLQAKRLAPLAREVSFRVEPGPSPSIRFPATGPYDERLGYRQLPQFIETLVGDGFQITAQSRMSPTMIELAGHGLFPAYREKAQAGLELHDCRGDSLYAARFPARIYDRFESIPPLLVDALLFIENRELLDGANPMRNPAVEWDRLALAVFDQAARLVDPSRSAPGGSTLATQIEKYRHSPEGRTDSGREKLRQMASASVRAYLDGENTMEARRRIVLDYLNTVPLAARPGFGEVNGIGDGMWAWYGRDFAEVNRALAAGGEEVEIAGEALQRQALAFKQALSLMIAQRRPSPYLAGNNPVLAELTDSHLRLMADAGLIPAALRDAALPIPLKLHREPLTDTPPSASDMKAAAAMRVRLQAMLGVPRAYDLDRLDLRADTTLDLQVQRAATQLLRGLKDPENAKAAGLYGFRLLSEGDDPGKLNFSFTLYERGEHGNLLRVQTDSSDQPFDINQGAKLDLGSTAKLRTLVTYLELMAQSHERWSGLDRKELAALELHPRDVLSKWVQSYLMDAPDKSLGAMLEAALERRYSASPGESFFTGGGLHTFANFDPEDNGRVMSMRDALKRSVNLPFIRLMRDMVQHLMHRPPSTSAQRVQDLQDPLRAEYLNRFADKEGRQFLIRFYRKLQGRSAKEAEELLLENRRPSAGRLAAVFYALEPEGSTEALARFIEQRLGREAQPDADELGSLANRYAPSRMSLTDRGYVAGIHPLELWLAGHLRRNPQATLGEVLEASKEKRLEVYGWLFKTRHKSAQDVRIRQLLEVDAFAEIHRSWQRLGYPFESITSSYATALGASGDRPAALAELMGILVNDGVRKPVTRVRSLAFARETPYETRLVAHPGEGERVLPLEVARVARRAAIDVVEGGTAQRLKGSLLDSDGKPVPIGGKTGTGDHRIEVKGRTTRVLSRSATFMFLIGDRYYGTMMAYVREPYAADYRFTSALPTQLLKSLTPVLRPLLHADSCGAVEERRKPADSTPLQRAREAAALPGAEVLPVAAEVPPEAASAPRVQPVAARVAG
ncbi:transglycosylase domain-containing protein [Caldimonas tepidiphila]|uniref:transglycosylase domain-containing protein n=1 Tax=Caldimonas tepidiphila TaxID=2315841 RepID=UPI001F0C611C|nr:transglycosylase domain-containing protein [Caldimonas tepidiphila]